MFTTLKATFQSVLTKIKLPDFHGILSC